MSEYVLEMTGVCKSFPGVKALDHAQLKLHPGKVHALMGENGAGKSTLMKCMFGIYKMDEGQIKIDGQPVTIHDPMDALEKGIAMVHQELQPIPARTIGENIFLGRYPMKKLLGFIPVVDHEKMYADTAKLLKKVRMDFDPKQMLGELSVSQMQSVEIAKAGLKLLVNHGNAHFQCFHGVMDGNLFAVKEDFAFVHLIDAEHTFHKCGFTGTIWTDQRQDPSLFQR